MLLATLMSSSLQKNSTAIANAEKVKDQYEKMCLFINRVSTTNLTYVKPFRAGIIPYVIYGNEVYFALGEHTETGDLTDFGGGVKMRAGEDALSGALRELSQESLGVFGQFSDKDPNVLGANLVYTKGGPPRFNKLWFWLFDTMIIFLKVNVDMNMIVENFNKKKCTVENPEVSNIIWLSFPDLQLLIQGKLEGYKLYELVRIILDKLFKSGNLHHIISK